jgi:hypothetical protein
MLNQWKLITFRSYRTIFRGSCNKSRLLMCTFKIISKSLKIILCTFVLNTVRSSGICHSCFLVRDALLSCCYVRFIWCDAGSRTVICCCPSPAQSFVVLSPVRTHDHSFVRSKTTYVFWNGASSSTKGGVWPLLSATDSLPEMVLRLYWLLEMSVTWVL